MTAITTFPVAASLQSAFESYTSTPATTFNSNYMQGVVGASFHSRNPNLFDRQIFSIQLPSASGSCSGIDAFAGSFSMITKDELVQMARGIAQGAPGYFFQLSIDAICGNCGANIKDLMKRLNSWNQLAQNSCQDFWNAAAQTDVVKSYQQSLEDIGNSVLPDKLTKAGALDDWGEWLTYRSEPVSGTLPDKVSTADAEVIANNAAMVLLDEASFNYTDVLSVNYTPTELFMSFIGRSITRIDDTSGKPVPEIDTGDATVDLSKFIFGPTVGGTEQITLLKCPATGDAKCLEPTPTTEVWEGLIPRFQEKLYSSNGTDGILQKMHAGVNLDPDQLKFVSTYRYPYLDFAKKCYYPAADKIADFMATTIAFGALSEFFNEITKHVLANINSNNLGPEHMITPAQVEKQIERKLAELESLKGDAYTQTELAQEEIALQLTVHSNETCSL
jgi:conjugative transfer pilus assembly protein TraH